VDAASFKILCNRLMRITELLEKLKDNNNVDLHEKKNSAMAVNSSVEKL